MKIYDCFSFNDENHLLEIRLNELNEYVDYFIIVEFGENHQGNPKGKNIDLNLIEKFKNKLRYYFVDKFNISNDPHGRDQFQRNYAQKGLYDAKDEDIIIISDIDEIPNLKNLNFDSIKENIIAFSQNHSMYKFNLILEEKWIGTKLCKYKKLKSPQWLRSLRVKKKYNILRIDKLLSPRYVLNFNIIENGGWHFGWLRNADSIISKLESYCHSEHNNEFYKDKKFIEKCKNEKKNFFDTNIKLKSVNLIDLPRYIQNNKDKYTEWLS